MRTTLPPLSATARGGSLRPAKRVVTCYDLLDLALEATDGGIEDFTEGIYREGRQTTYADAQRYQAEWLLDQIHCRPGFRLLDIGCGNGTLLERAGQRGAQATGITISPRQVERCRKKGLDVLLCDYRQLPASHRAAYDGLVANGSMEHFVQADQAAAGRSDAIYRQMFAICHRLLAPGSSGRLVTTTIHFGRVRIDPRQMVHGPLHFRWGSDAFHYAMLVHSFGGFYPVPGQLERCAAPYFRLVDQQDGTRDYLWTSAHWLNQLKRSLARSPHFQRKVVGKFLHHPVQTPRMITCLLLSQSWNWQFRGADPPMRLWRQVWEADWRPAPVGRRAIAGSAGGSRAAGRRAPA